MPIISSIYICDDLYSPADQGCRRATEYLGRQSTCKLCPFVDCIETDRGHSRFNGMTTERWRKRLEKKGLVVGAR